MRRTPSHKPAATRAGLSRRQFVKIGGTALTAGSALSGCPRCWTGQPGELPYRPNLVLLMTDQERFPQHWPEGWADTYLPNRKRLSDHGLTFTQACCNSAMCSPSRATLFTGLYPAQNGVKRTLHTGDPTQPTLHPSTPNMAHLLASAGYNVQYRGKWHMSKDPTGTADIRSRAQLARYGFHGWMPPEGGQDEDPANFGGGCANYDGEYAEQAARFLRHVAPHAPQPFALIVSLINPHDIMAHPSVWDTPSVSDIPEYADCGGYGSEAPDCFDQGIAFPPTATEDLAQNYKPSCQAEYLDFCDAWLGALESEEQRRNYINFYAYLQRLSDQHMGTVLDALEANPAVHENTIVIRLADHGEMGLAHGGMRGKTYNAYEETIHVPLVIANPRLFPQPVRTEALASVIDIMPTLANLAAIPNPEQWDLKGRDLTPIIQDAVDHPENPTAAVQENILFTTDDYVGQMVQPPHNVRCLREARWKFVEYIDPEGMVPPQYELYDRVNDPDELHNMADPASPWYEPVLTREMQTKLWNRLAEADIQDG